MAAISHNKDDLSVDNVHTPFGLTKRPPAMCVQPRNESIPRISVEGSLWSCCAPSPYP